MATQRITIAKLGGAAADAAEKFFKRWAALSPDAFNQRQFASEATSFFAALRRNAMQAPMLFYAEHVDMWSVGHSLFRHMPLQRKRPILSTGKFDLLSYRLPDRGKLERALQTSLKVSAIRSRRQQEDRWFLLSLLEAVHAWEGVCSKSLLIIAREAFDVSMTDEELGDACKRVPTWLRRMERK